MSDDKKKSEEGGASPSRKSFSLNRMASGGGSDRKLPIQSLTPGSSIVDTQESSSPLSLLGSPTARDNSGREAPDEPDTSESPGFTTVPSPKPNAKPTTPTSAPGDTNPGAVPDSKPKVDTTAKSPSPTPDAVVPKTQQEGSKSLDEDREIVLQAWIKLGGAEEDLIKGSRDNISDWVGTVVDQDSNRVTKLTWSEKGFKDQIPPELGRLSKLLILDLSSQSLSGQIPVEIGNLKELKTLHVEHNALTGEIPDALGECEALEDLGLEKNHLNGPLPKALGNCSKLKMVRVHENENLDGKIPVEFGQCLNLEELSLNGNNLTGGIPKELGNCKKLHILNLQDNNERFIEETPDEVSSLPRMEKIHFNSGIHAQGRLGKDGKFVMNLWESLKGDPKAITMVDGVDVGFDVTKWNLVTVKSGRITRLDWYNQNLSGTINSEISKLDELFYLGIGRNLLNGGIPASIGTMVHLSVIELSNNRLSGPVPDLSKCVDLNQLLLHGNKDLIADEFDTGPLTKLTKLHLPNKELKIMGKLGEDIELVEKVWIALGGEPQVLKNNNVGDVSKWKGVELIGGRVGKLDWKNMDLGGVDIPGDICKISHLEVLDLSENNISGRIPAGIGDLTELKLIKLGQNSLQNSIPDSLKNCEKLEVIHLHNNQLVGNIPDCGKMKQLKVLYLQQNKIQGTIPIRLGECDNLQEIRLGKNELTGSIPKELGSCKHLTELYVQENPDMDHTLPKEIEFRMKKLTRLFLNTGLQIKGKLGDDAEAVLACWTAMGGTEENLKIGAGGDIFKWSNVTVDDKIGRVTELKWERENLNGKIPEAIGKLTKLKLLKLGQNSLTGTIPDEIGQLRELEVLRLFENALTGPIPKAIGKCANLRELRLENNKEDKQGLCQTIPEELGNCKELRFLRLEENNFDGPIPASLGKCIHLEEIHLNNNDLTGAIPPELGMCKELIKLNLQNNDESFSKVVPFEVEKLEKLTRIYLNGDLQIRGKLSDDAEAVLEIWEALGGDEETLRKGEENDVYKWEKVFIEDGRVTKLDWSEQNFKESIPPAIHKLDKLKVLNLSSNKIKDSIPEEIGLLQELTELRLDRNNISGSIPPALGGTEGGTFSSLSLLGMDSDEDYPGCKNLKELHLNYNDLTGEIPESLGNCINLVVLNLNFNSLYGEIPKSLGQCLNLEALLLNKNQLGRREEEKSGIPDSLGRLVKLKRLYLQYNKLTGVIPGALGLCGALEELWLNNNQLEGAIPQGLGECKELQKLYVQENSALFKKNVPSDVDELTSLTNLQVDSNGETSTGLLGRDLKTLKQLWKDMGMKVEILQKGSKYNVKKWFGVTVDDKINRVIELDWSGSSIEAFKKKLAEENDKEDDDEDDDNDTKKEQEASEKEKEGTELGEKVEEVEKNEEVGEIEEVEENVKPDQVEIEQQAVGDKLTGKIPDEIGNLDELQCLNLSQNSLSETIPKTIGKLKELTVLRLDDNKLIGEIPCALGACVSLNVIHLEKNELIGGVPSDLKGCARLSKLYVQENHSGLDILPTVVESIEWLNLVHLNNKEDVKIIGYLGKDAEAVQACWDALGGAPEMLTNGAGNDIFNWSEVTISKGRVTKLNWSEKGLTGEISKEIGNIKMLSELILSRNSLSGEIPITIGQLQNLVKLDLNHNYLSYFYAEIGNCAKLQELNLQQNKLAQELPKDCFHKLSNLKKLFLSNNLLTGEIPEDIGKCVQLEDFRVSKNKLQGDVGSTLEALVNCNALYRIWFNGNPELKDDNVPPSVKGLDALTWLVLPQPKEDGSNNVQPRGNLGKDAENVLKIWKGLGGDTKVLRNDAGDNVEEWANVTVAEAGGVIRVTELDWNKQDLYGNIPKEIGFLKSLKVLNLGQNVKTFKRNDADDDGEDEGDKETTKSLSGTIPEEMGNLSNLKVLRLNGNQFEGQVPKILSNCKMLEELYLDDNKLTGNFPSELGKLPLKKLHVQHNQLDGIIPSELDISKELDLNALAYYDNNDLKAPNRQKPIDVDKSALKMCWKALGGDPAKLFNGEPKDHSKWKGVKVVGYRVTEIDWSNCKLSGNVPPQFRNLSALTLLNLSKNNLQGAIAKELGLLGELQKLIINKNKLSGEIPAEFNKCKELTHLDLSKNQLWGDIPNLDQTALKFLNLEYNDLDGEIPETLGRLNELTHLYLNNNRLSGEFPSELKSLNDLKVLSVHFNGLHGLIPSELEAPDRPQELKLTYGSNFPMNNNKKDYPLTAKKREQVVGKEIEHVKKCWEKMGGPLLLGPSGHLKENHMSLLYRGGGDKDIRMWKGVKIDPETGRVAEIGKQWSLISRSIQSIADKQRSLTHAHLQSGLPAELGGLGDYPGCTALEELSVSNNKLGGEIPKELGSLKQLKVFKINSNEFEGDLPESLGELTNLETFQVDNNALVGKIPKKLDERESLGIHDLQYSANAGLLAETRDGVIKKEMEALEKCWIHMNTKPNEDVSDNSSCTTKLYMGSPSDHSKWKGITIVGYRVTEIALTKLDLSENKLSGEILESLGNCKKLKFLNLSNNELKGEIPEALKMCKALTEISLSSNQLTGDIPSILGKLPELTSIKLNNNSLSGSFPSELGKLNKLKVLHVHYNQLSGKIPKDLDNKPQLIKRDVQKKGNEKELDVDTRPTSKGLDQKSVDTLDLIYGNNHNLSAERRDTDIKGDMAALLVCWKTMQGHEAEIKKQAIAIQSQKRDEEKEKELLVKKQNESLKILYDDVGDKDVSQWKGITVNEKGRVTEIDWSWVSGNKLKGEIPEEIGNLTELTILKLKHNEISGKIPETIGELKQLKELDLQNNQFSEEIPIRLGACENMTILNLRDNKLNGEIPEALCSMVELVKLQLNQNELRGKLPVNLRNLKKLKKLHVHNNKLSGLIPPELDKKPVGALDLVYGNNIPDNKGEEDSERAQPLEAPLREAPVRSDKAAVLKLWAKMTGGGDSNDEDEKKKNPEESLKILYSAGGDKDIWTWTGITINDGRVTEIDWSSRVFEKVKEKAIKEGGKKNAHIYKLKGTFHEAIGNLEELTKLILYGNELTGYIPAKIGDCKKLEVLDLRKNKLMGDGVAAIPRPLGKCSKLSTLCLSHNDLVGKIPQFLGNLKRLTDIKLNHNHFAGELPNELIKLTKLKKLHVHYNQLSGRVPKELDRKPTNALDFVYGNNAVTELICDKGHALAEFELSSRRRCDVCKRNIKAESTIHRCTNPSCDYNLCGVCTVGLRADYREKGLKEDMEDIKTCWKKMFGGKSEAKKEESVEILYHKGGDKDLRKWKGVKVEEDNNNNPRVTEIDWSKCGLNGYVPSDVGNLTALIELKLSDNNLNGPLPQNIGKLKLLQVLDFQNNELISTIPSEFGQLSSLKELYLNNNKLSGSLPPAIGNCKEMVNISLYNNQMGGSLPPSLCELANLKELYLYTNCFSGSLPKSLEKLSKLEVLNITDNLFTGKLPSTLTKLENLKQFRIMGNNFLNAKKKKKKDGAMFSLPEEQHEDEDEVEEEEDEVSMEIPEHFKEMSKKLGSEFVTDWNKNELYLERAEEAIKSIKDDDIRTKVNRLQRELCKHIQKEEQTKVENVFKKLTSIAKRETDRLGKVTAIVLLNYRFRDNGHRYKEIEGIKEKNLNPQITVPGENVERKVELLLSMAVWREKDFQDRLMNDIVDPMNMASSITELCKVYEIDACDYTHDKFGEPIDLVDSRYKFSEEDDNNANFGKETRGKRKKSMAAGRARGRGAGYDTSSNMTSPRGGRSGVQSQSQSGTSTPDGGRGKPDLRQMLSGALSVGSTSPGGSMSQYGTQVYNADDFDDVNPEEIEEQTLVKARFGPPKSYQRALTKEKEGLEKLASGKYEAWNGLRDLNRVTLEFEDPLMLVLAYKAILQKYKVSGLKKKFEAIDVESYEQPPDIHMNLDFGELDSPWLVEVQLMYSSILTIKKELHKFYDIVRATNPRDIMSPLFKDFKTNEDRQIDEKKKLKDRMEREKTNLRAHLIDAFNNHERTRSQSTGTALAAATPTSAGGGQTFEFGEAGNLPAPPGSPLQHDGAKTKAKKRVSMRSSKE
ncbi:hypothetical protein TL16_g03398 [Triparma laevis f. inornata]|uniref:non-specific serine/threonine protein kinase n=1 Tax=Triparma laevis f. inornata TaxID=1714386 RepID=A0A9W7E4H3_9STRA|nr:hypothetical protein TL16_g03398 [Triparma laevis f. inornata]